MGKLSKLVAFAGLAACDTNWGPITTPIDVIAQDGNCGDACITCYSCLHQSIDGVPSGGNNCLAGPFDTLTTYPYYKEWCITTPGVDYEGSSSYNGTNGDFLDLVCDEGQTKMRSSCASVATLRTDNASSDYRIDRKSISIQASIYEEGQLGLIFGEQYKLEESRLGQYYCTSDGCNSLALSSGPTGTTRNDEISCIQCDTSDKNDLCWSLPEALEPEVCELGTTACSIVVQGSCNNYNGVEENGPNDCQFQNEEIIRGCAVPDMNESRETILSQMITEGCFETDLCNRQQITLTPEDLGPLPLPGRWDVPLNEYQQNLFCGFGGVECITCHTCVDEDMTGSCTTLEGEAPETFVYRRRYFDESLDQWVRNVCQTRVVSAEAVAGGEQTQIRAVLRSVAVLTENDFLNYRNKIAKTPGTTIHLDWDSSSPKTECHRCFGDSSSDCADGTSTQMESCSTGVCMARHDTDGNVFRSCLNSERAADIVKNNDLTEYTDNGHFFSCDGNLCNDQLTNEGHIINQQEDYTWGRVTPPFSSMPNQYPADCGLNGDACITCIMCTHQSVNNDPTGGLNCRQGPYDNIDKHPYYKEWCTTTPGYYSSYGTGGINNDFLNLVCDEYQTKMRTGCQVWASLQTDNEMASYLITRGVFAIQASLYENNELGLVFGDQYKLEESRTGDYFCTDNDCNNLDLQSPPIDYSTVAGNSLTRNDNLQCAQCATRDKEDACWNDPSKIESVQCFGAGSSCQIRVTGSCNNYDGAADGEGNDCMFANEQITRGCSNREMNGDNRQTNLRQDRRFGCFAYNACNGFSVSLDAEDVGPLPRPGRWDVPLNDVQQELFCGFGGVECIQCESCVEDTIFGSCGKSNGVSNGANEKLVYRRRYFDESLNQWVRNVCQTRLVDAEATVAGASNQFTAVLRSVVVMTETNYQNNIDMVVNTPGYKTVFDWNDNTECPRCFGAAGSDCAIGGSVSTESCPSGVCMARIETNGETFRSCLNSNRIADIVKREQVSEFTDTGSYYTCSGNLCNVQPIDDNSNIITEWEDYQTEMDFPASVADCEDSEGSNGNTDLCLRCVTCEYETDNFDYSSAVSNEQCIRSDSYGQSWFLKAYNSDDQETTYCGYSVVRRRTTNGWKFTIRRGGFRKVNPLHVMGDSLVRRSRSSVYQCMDELCNGWDIDLWPLAQLPPVPLGREQIMSDRFVNEEQPLSKHTTSSSEKNTNGPVYCIECDQSDTDCFNNAAGLNQIACTNGQVCDAYYNITLTRGLYDRFWTSQERIERGCWNPLEGTLQYSFEWGIEDGEFWVCEGDNCNGADPPEVWLPPQSFLPVDASRWQSPLSDEEIELCGESGEANKIECIECYFCDNEFLYGENDEMPQPSCELKTFRAYYVNPFATNQLIYNQCSTVIGYRTNNLCEDSTRVYRKGVTQWPELFDDEVTKRDLYLTTIIFETTTGTCPQCAIGQNCLLPSNFAGECVPTGNLCFDVQLGDGLQVRSYESGCASVEQAILYGAGKTTINEVFQIEVCTEFGCNNVGSETPHDPEIECYQEEDYDTAEAIPVFDESACDVEECIECVSCEFFVDDAGYSTETVDPCAEKPMAKFFKYTQGVLGPVENFCGMRLTREQSTYGWKYRVKRGALERVNPMTMMDDLNILQRYRQSLLQCEDNLCNGWDVNSWPLYPIITPRSKRETSREEKQSGLQCFECDSNEANCLNNAERVNAVTCAAGQKCSAYYNEYRTMGDIFWETQLDITRQCYDVVPDEWSRSFEFIVRDSELWACIGDGCNGVDIESVLGGEYVPPLSTLPVDASRWEEPVTDEEAEKYCGNGIDCVKCHYCEQEFTDSYPENYECPEKYFRATYLNPFDTSQLVRNQCGTKVSYMQNDKCSESRRVAKGVLQRTDDQIVKFQEREATRFTEGSSCKVCGRGENCADATATCSSNNGFCSEVFGNDETVIESNCGTNLQALDWNSGIRSKTEWFQLETCGNSESCNQPGSEEKYMPTAECTPSSAISYLVSLTTLITLLFI